MAAVTNQGGTMLISFIFQIMLRATEIRVLLVCVVSISSYDNNAVFVITTSISELLGRRKHKGLDITWSLAKMSKEGASILCPGITKTQATDYTEMTVIC